MPNVRGPWLVWAATLILLHLLSQLSLASGASLPSAAAPHHEGEVLMQSTPGPMHRHLAALGGSCALNADCTGGSNQVCSSSVCKCDQGYYAVSAVACAACVPGKYSATVGATAPSVCLDCISGKYSDAGALQCSDCAAGKYESSQTTTTTLELRAGGTYLFNGVQFSASGTSYTNALSIGAVALSGATYAFTASNAAGSASLGTLSWNGASYTLTPSSTFAAVNSLMVAGGAAGGYSCGEEGGGGGGGGRLAVGTMSLSGGVSYQITVGGGGVSTYNCSPSPCNGGDTVLSASGISTITLPGGGAGGIGQQYSSYYGAAGGSGGGGNGAFNDHSGGASIACTGCSGLASYGNNGGTGYWHYGGGGGGGAVVPGQSIATHTGGNGGSGYPSSLTGTSATYGSGGGGGASQESSTGGTGGAGAGDGAGTNAAPANTVANFGGGGGGARGPSCTNGGSGGSGIVVFALPMAVRVCTACANGKYSDAAATVCTGCPAGKFDNNNAIKAGIATCTDCSAGRYYVTAVYFTTTTQTSPYASMCTACAAGKYNTLTAQTADTCAACPAGTWSVILGASAQAQCTNCVAGKYNVLTAQTADTCLPCVPGKYSATVGATAPSVCLDCISGKYSDAGALQCSDCAAGKYESSQTVTTTLELRAGGTYLFNGVQFSASGTSYTNALSIGAVALSGATYAFATSSAAGSASLGTLSWNGASYTLTPSSAFTAASALMVAGGGAGGYSEGHEGGGGGGGGGVAAGTMSMSEGVSYQITVGVGGVSTSSCSPSTCNGGSTTLSAAGTTTVTLAGGGRGGIGSPGAPYSDGVAGGSGGGANGYGGPYHLGGGASGCSGCSSYAGLKAYGNSGGSGGVGGGGGAVSVGESGSDNGGKNGGNGYRSAATGSDVYYGAGGGGGAPIYLVFPCGYSCGGIAIAAAYVGYGGTGAGNGGITSSSIVNAPANTGGGGGGARGDAYTGANGGTGSSGIVVFGLPTAVRTCTACMNGKYSDAAATVCTDCPAGKFDNNNAIKAGIATCSDCGSGKYNTLTAQTGDTCVACAADKFSFAVGASSADVCLYFPTGLPSGQPTMQPSSQPSIQPSGQPSGRPTAQPSSQPSSLPSGRPTMQPSCQPTTQPTSGPTSRPTSQPAGFPTSLPTMQPTTQPSTQPTSRPSHNCQPGQYLETAMNTCLKCPLGKYNPETDPNITEGEETCIMCPAGKYSNSVGMPECAVTMPGYSTLLGASQPTLCGPSFYSDAAGSDACIACPSGTVTTFFGADSKNKCVSPGSNFIQGYIAVAIDVIFGFQYLLRGRFHRVAFIRLKRILESLSANAGGTITYISYLRVKASSERLNITVFRRAKTWLFIVSIAFILLVTSTLAFLSEFSTIFFKALVIFKSLHLKFDFGTKIAHIISQFGHDVWSQVVTTLLGAMTTVLQYVSYFKIDVAVIAVNCQGATAPFTMFLNMLVLGTALMFIDGRFQEFLLLKCKGLISAHSSIIGKHTIKEWYMRQDGTKVRATKRGKVVYYSISAILLVLKSALSVDLIQTLLQFIISTVNVSVFFENGLLHGYDKNCNVVAGWTGAEASIAFMTSVANWVFIVPAMYTISRVLIPRLPPGVASFDASKDDASLFRSYIGLHRVLKLFSYFSPDLWMSFLTSKYLHRLPYHIPAWASKSSVSLSRKKAEESPAVDDIDKASSEHSDDAEGATLAQATLLSAIETPLYPTYRIACNAKATYIGLYRCKSIACKYKKWHQPTMYITDAGDNYVLVKITRSTGLVESTLTYDVNHEGLNAEGRNAADLAIELNSTSEQYLVVLVVLANEHTSHRLEGGLAEAVLRCGGSKEIFGASKLQGSYLLIGVPGCGDRSGYECVSINSEVEFCVDFSVLKPEHGKLGWKIDEEISSSKSFLTVASKIRSQRENTEWKQLKQITLPTYWELCVMECKAMLAVISQLCGCDNCLQNIALTPILAVLAAAGLGHVITSVGRRAMYVMYWNYSRFLMFAAGIVTTDLAFIYDIHENIHRDSCVWNDASVVALHRLPDIVSQPRDNLLFTDKQSSLSSRDGNDESVLPTSVNIDKVVNNNNDSGAVLQSDDQQYNRQQYNRYEERKKVLERDVLQDQLRVDYGICIYASIATRATLFQMFPYVSFLSMFAAFTSEYPLFVYDKYLESNLMEGIVCDPFTRWRQMAQQEIDLEYELRTKETREDSYVLPVPPEGETNAYGTREQVEAKNSISREIFRQVVAQDKPLVREWEVYLQGVVWYLTGSRYIQYGKGVFKFSMSVLLLYCGDKSSKLLVAVMLVCLSPFVLVQCLQVVARLGTTDNMCITDAELMRELGWLLRFLQAAYRCLSSCFSFFLKKNGNSQSEHSPDEGRRRSDPSSPPDDSSANSIEMWSMAVEGLSVVNPMFKADSAPATAAASEDPKEAVAPESECIHKIGLLAFGENTPASTAEPVEPAVTIDPIARSLPAAAAFEAPPGDTTLPVGVVSSETLTYDQDGHFSALSRSRKMALEFEEIAERASISSASTSRTHVALSTEREDDAHSLSRSRKMALEFEEIAEKASMSTASTTRKLDTLHHMPAEREDNAHSLSRSRKMALDFEEIAERAALGSAADLSKKDAAAGAADIDEVSTAAERKERGSDSLNSKELKHHRAPAIKREFAGAIESAKRRADLEYSL